MLWPNGTKTRPTVSDPFRCRELNSNGQCTRFHYGTDFIGFSQVRAVAAGTVSHVGYMSGWVGGFMVWINHDGFSTRSLHLVNNSAPVVVGQSVAEGAVIGTMGNTDSPGGTHLHLEVVVGGTQVNPEPYITDRLNNPPTEEDMPSVEEIMNYNINRQGPGQSGTTNLATTIAWLDSNLVNLNTQLTQRVAEASHAIAQHVTNTVNGS